MNRAIAECLAVILSSTGVLAQSKLRPTDRQFTASDASRAIITQVGAGRESQVDMYTSHLAKVCSLDFSSEDEEHGYTGAKAKWTADEDFFLFSRENSEGHSPWHIPTPFMSFGKYSPEFRYQVRLLDSYPDDPGTTTPDFQLTSPNSLTTRVYGRAKT